jgi:predicted ester cyclase
MDATELARRLIERVWATADRETARELVADDVLVHVSRSIQPGPDGQAAVGTYFRAGFPEAIWSADDAFGVGDQAAVRWRMQGRHDGTFEGVPPTHRDVVLSGIAIVRVEGGKIVEIWHAEDLFGLFARIGAKPETTATVG